MQNVELFPKSELDGIIAAEAALRTINTTLLTQAAVVDKLRPAILGITTSLKDMVNGEQMLAAIEKEVEKSEADILKIYAQLSPALRTVNQERANARVVLAAENRELKLNAQEVNATANSLNALTTRLSQMKIAVKNLDLDSPEFKQMSADILELNTRISTAEQSMGTFGRNVGNYNSAFSGIGFQVQQLARELPSLAVSPQMFFLAISNNLPMLGDAIRMMKAYNEQQKAVGGTTVSVGKTILKSIFSWQTLIVAGITALTLYGSEIVNWVGGLLKGKDAALDAAGAIREINKAAGEDSQIGESIANYEKLQGIFSRLGNDASAKKGFIEDYREELDKTELAINNVNDAEYFFSTDGEIAFRQTVKNRAMALAGMELASKKYQEALSLEMDTDNVEKWQAKIDRIRLNQEKGYGIANDAEILRLQNRINKRNENIESLRQEGDAYVDTISQIETNTTKLNPLDDGSTSTSGSDSTDTNRPRMGALNAERKAIEDLATAEIDSRMAVIERTLAADRTATADRMTLTNELYDLEEQRIKQLAEVQRANLTQKNIDENTTYNDDESVASTIDEVQAAANVKNQLLLLEIATDQAMIDSVDDRIKEINALEDRGIEDNIRAFEMQMQERQRIIDQDESAELAALSAQYSGILSNQQEYEDKRLAVTRKYADLRQMAEIEALETQLAELKKDGNITIDEQQKIADLEAQIADYKVEINRDANDRIIEDDERARDKRIENLKRIQDAAFELMDLMGEIAQLNTDRQLADLDKQQKAAEDAAEEEQERVERLADAGAITEEQKNARIALSEQELAERQEIIDARRAQIEKRQARFNVLLSTAQAIMKAVSSAPWPLNLIPIGFATAFGAVQLAAVSAAQYAKGTPDGGHPGGLAWVGDGGRAEAVIYGGKAYKTPAIPTLMDLPKGAEVLPDWRDVIKSSLAHDLITEPRGGVNNYYDVPASSTYNDKGVRLGIGKMIEQQERLIREIRRGRKEDKITAFKNMKLKGIN